MRRQRLAPVLIPGFGIVDDVVAVCQVTWGLVSGELVASCSDCDTAALVLELPRPGRERVGAGTLADGAPMGRAGTGRASCQVRSSTHGGQVSSHTAVVSYARAC